MDIQPQEPGSPLAIARAALAVIGTDPDTIVQVSVIPGGYGACDALALTMADGVETVVKALLPGAPSEHIAALKREALFYQHVAPRVPIRTPHIHGLSTDESVGVVVLMDRHQPSPPPSEWPGASFITAAGDLARLHASFWDRTDDLSQYAFLSSRSPEVSDAELAHARECWAYLSTLERFQTLLSPDRMRWLDTQMQTVRGRLQHLAAIPPALIHGDCHVGNIVFDRDGGMVWTDWTGASIGRGVEDLSFLYQRAEVAGGSVPWEAMLEEYHRRLQSLCVDVRFATLRKSAEASEWSVRLLQWPHYMDWTSAETLAAFLSRLDALAATA